MCVPSFIVRRHVPKHIASNSIGYRHMLRFYTFMLASHPAVSQGVDYVMRMDTDSLLIDDLHESPFFTLQQSNATFVVKRASLLIARASAVWVPLPTCLFCSVNPSC